MEIEMERDWTLAAKLSRLSDDVLVGVEEVAALTGFSKITVRQQRLRDFPDPIECCRVLRWRLGQVRNWGKPDEIKNIQPNDAQKVSDRTSKTKTKAKVGHPRLPSDLHLQSTK